MMTVALRRILLLQRPTPSRKKQRKKRQGAKDEVFVTYGLGRGLNPGPLAILLSGEP
jgi:hypothetical protein